MSVWKFPTTKAAWASDTKGQKYVAQSDRQLEGSLKTKEEGELGLPASKAFDTYSSSEMKQVLLTA